MSINNIDKIFRDGMRDSKPEVPGYVWDQIADSLDGKRKKKRTVWYVAASVAILLGAGAFLMKTDASQPMPVATEQSSPSGEPVMHSAEIMATPMYADSAVYVSDSAR